MISVSELGSLSGKTNPARLARLRNWTKMGLLLPLPPYRRPGTGNRKLYSEKEIGVATTLEMLSSLGVRVAGKRKFVLRIANDPALYSALKLLSSVSKMGD